MRTALVTGANRGIGLELVRQYAEQGWRVIACCREPSAADELEALAAASDRVSIERLDLDDIESIDVLAERLRGTAIDLLVNNAGVISPFPMEEHIHRQRFGAIDYDLWADILRTNTLGTVKVTEAFTEHVAGSSDKMIVNVSSTTGSIAESDRSAIAYTTSKAALNKATTIIARALGEREVIVLALCPGHVKTRMGIGGAGLEIEDSVSGMREVIAGLTLADSGTFRRYNGDVVAW